MQSQTSATEDGNAPAATRSRRWSRSQQEELRKILENKWWPFDRADTEVLKHLHKQLTTKNNEEVPPALL